MSDDLGHVVGEDQKLDGLIEVPSPLDGAIGVAARPVDVLVGDTGRGVDGVHDDVRPLLHDQPVEVVLGRRTGVESCEQAFDVATAAGGLLVDLAARHVLEVVEGEDVAPGGLELGPSGFGLEPSHGFFGFLLLEREQDQARRRPRAADAGRPLGPRGRSRPGSEPTCPGCPRLLAARGESQTAPRAEHCHHGLLGLLSPGVGRQLQQRRRGRVQKAAQEQQDEG